MVSVTGFPSEEYIPNARDSILEMRVDREILEDIFSRSVCYNKIPSQTVRTYRLRESRSLLFTKKVTYLFKPVRKLVSKRGKEEWDGTRITTAAMFRLGFCYRLVWCTRRVYMRNTSGIAMMRWTAQPTH